ncbi:MAG: amino acid permease [Pseudomonadota bacterium]|jgi:Amino acid transporters|nr:MAG: arginine:agmatine antiporter [Pseudomonadota bacterium]
MASRQKVGALLATALVASNMVGSGIYLLPATLATVGSITVLGWLIAGGGALLIASVLARLGRIAPRPGGPSTYAGEAFGPYVGFQSSMLYWVQCWVGNIAIAVAATGYLATFIKPLAEPLPGALGTTAIIWVLVLLNIIGPRLVCQFKSFAIVVGLIPILAVATVGWLFFDADTFTASWNVRGEPALPLVSESLVLVFWAFLGLESASVAAAVVENPRSIALATMSGVLIATLVYLASCTVIMGLIPAEELAKSTAPFADAVRVVLGSVAGGLVALMALTKALGTLAGWILLTAQIGKAGADRGHFPAILAKVDRHGTPVANLLLMGVLMTVVVFATVSPTLGEQFGKLIEVSVVLCLLVYTYACASVWHYDQPETPPAARLRERLLAAAAMLFAILMIALSGTQMLLITAALVLVTIPLYALARRRAAALPA